MLLDVKTHAVSQRVLSALVRQLNRWGVAVLGVGSFSPEHAMQRMEQPQAVRLPPQPLQRSPAALHTPDNSPPARRATHGRQGAHGAQGAQGGAAATAPASVAPAVADAASDTGDAGDEGETRVQRFPAPMRILFVAFAGDVLRLARRGRLVPGMRVMFNGGSLLRPRQRWLPLCYQFAPDPWWQARVLAQLREVKQRLNLSLGLYVQEFDMDAGAAREMFHVCNQHQDLIDMGLAWGGLLDVVPLDVTPTVNKPAVGLSLMVLMGHPAP